MFNIPLTPSGRLHPCFPYYEQFQFCSSKTYYQLADCKEWHDDYLQCTGKTKLTAMMAEAEKERRKHKLITVPRYNKEKDIFVFDDGRTVENSDPIFKEIPWR